jgi:hypothetical protein
MPRVKNPHYVSPVATYEAANKAAFEAWLGAPEQAAKPFVTFDDIRAGFPNAVDPVNGAKPLTDGTIATVLAELGYEVSQ